MFNPPRAPYRSDIPKDARKARRFHADGKIMPDWWADISFLNTHAGERTGYPTQKPTALYRRIIRAGSNPGGVVLDPFAGSGTTLIAAEQEGRRWAGADRWPGGMDVVLERLAGEVAVGSGRQGDALARGVTVLTGPAG